MKKQNINYSNPDEFNKHLQHTSPVTWIVLIVTTGLLIAFFAWGFFYKLVDKIIGAANIVGGEVTLTVKPADVYKLAKGQKVYISDKEGEILSINDEGQPVVSEFTLPDGEYTYKVVIKEIRPIDFLLGK